MRQIRVASLFAGIGGICQGFKNAGADIIWANEWNAPACRTYRYNWGSEYLLESDVRKVDFHIIPEFDILAAGFPCQPFSIAGRQDGFADPRGNLFFEISRLVDIRRPRIVFLENVSNLAEHDNGRTFLVIYTTLVHLGYYIKYAIMQADQYANIPQTRNRIYIAAFYNLDDCQVFSFPEPIPLTAQISDTIQRSEKKHDIYYYQEDSEVCRKYGNLVKNDGYIYRLTDRGIVRVKNKMCPTLTANMGFYPNRVPLVRDQYGLRKLTLRECLDFQGFPVQFKFPASITIDDAYRQIGNSVCIPVIKRIASNLINLFESKHEGDTK